MPDRRDRTQSRRPERARSQPPEHARPGSPDTPPAPEVRRLTLLGPTAGGYHLAHDRDGTWFVGYGARGETVEAVVTRRRGRVGFAHAAAVVADRSAERAEPPCPYFGPGRCGGCQLQHLELARQRADKAEVVAEQMRRIGGLANVPVQPAVGLRTPWHYRAHAVLHIVGDGSFGFVEEDSPDLLPIETCLIVHPAIAAFISAGDTTGLPAGARVRVHQGSEAGDFGATHVDTRGRVIAPLTATTRVTHQVRGRRYAVDVGGFFQVNAEGAGLLLETVEAMLGGRRFTAALDLFCGVGLFTLLLGDTAERVLGVEASAEAVACARLNAERAHAHGVSFLAEAAEGAAAHLEALHPELVVVDPLRAGLKPVVIDAIADAPSVTTLVYVSCDPASLARDLKGLVGRGFSIARVQPIDLFPHTHHIETVVLLER
jgi:tRNA/tmRNA/rRNA uracil-C5-methylase (TrmA/RlmC/RlmD family)